ncbi:MAG: tRNA lysidine(34) synthetase TilS [Thermoleophilia bacterium]|nr:tRNA lysidine(34) synthetase TilS [Thermoleophilia bacterium]
MSRSDGGGSPPSPLIEAIRDSGLIEPGSSGVVLLSGGPDSISLLAGLTGSELEGLVALHLNYGLRDESDADQAVCEAACARLGVELVARRAGVPEGNIQNWARALRYAAAEELRNERGADWIAVGHTEDDVAETVLYRLAASPGRRAAAAMKPASGRIVRPLISLTRTETRALAEESGLGFVDDASNEDSSFARVRIRREVLPVLSRINPAAPANLALTRAELIEEGDFLDGLARALLDRELGEVRRLPAAALMDLHPAMRRLVIRALAERETGEAVPVSIELAADAWRLANQPEGGLLDLGRGHRLRMEAGTVAVESDSPAAVADGVEVSPGHSVLWAGWAISAAALDPPFEPAGPDVATLDSAGLAPVLTVRGWQPGDRIQPLGMEGSKSLQDLFTDAGVPRSDRGQVPVVVSGAEVVWVAGLAVAHRHRLRPETTAAVRLSAARA